MIFDVYFLTLPLSAGPFCGLFRGQKINANFFGKEFFDNPSGHGRPRRKSWTSAPKSAFSCGPSGGEKLFAGHPGVRVRNVRRKSGPKSLCLCCFFFSDFCGALAKLTSTHQKSLEVCLLLHSGMTCLAWTAPLYGEGEPHEVLHRSLSLLGMMVGFAWQVMP